MHKNKLVYGVGVNDADYQVVRMENGKQVSCPFYRKWKNMLERCYSAEYQARCQTYVGCQVCQAWRSFMAFKGWMEKQAWQGKEMDKDLCGNGKLYSPDTCVFISHELNHFTTDSGAKRGTQPIGVCKVGKRFKSYVSMKNKKLHLGFFPTPEEAHCAWLAAKTKLANDLIESELEPRIIQGIKRYVNRLHSIIANDTTKEVSEVIYSQTKVKNKSEEKTVITIERV